MLVRVLLQVDDPALIRRLLKLGDQPNVAVAEGPRGRLSRLESVNCDLVLFSRDALPLPARDAVARVRGMPDRPEIVVLTETDDAEANTTLLEAGCLAVIPVDGPGLELETALTALIARRREALIERLDGDRSGRTFRLGDAVSKSARMKRFFEIAERIAPSESTVLILGETGVGKERLAQAIHAASRRSDGPFVVLNCGAIPESLLESELFGHEEGAFTGAVRSRRGYFELANRGTLFLDEIGELPAHLQVKLLRTLQARQVQRLGSERTLSIDVRVLAATNRDLEKAMADGHFRADLYYRLSVVSLEIPPLRERTEDIPDLVDHYLSHFQTQIPGAVTKIRPDALHALERYSWPGNVRELINVVERAVLLCTGDEIGLDELPESIVGIRTEELDHELVDSVALAVDQLDTAWLSKPLGQAKREWLLAFERAYLDGLLRETGGRIGETARRAGIVPRSLYTKMRSHGLRKEDYRNPRHNPD